MFLFSSTETRPADRIHSAIRNAAQTTGTGFDYLLTTARRESSLDPSAKAQASSATGLFQFIDSTWMQMVKEEGPALGLQAYADTIQRGAGGRYDAASPEARRAVLALREDPDVSALMAGAFTRRNHDHLADALGREPSSGELYIAHFMGAGGAASLIRLAATDGGANAAEAFPRQAAANQGIFYDKAGQARSVAQVYALLVRNFDAAQGPAAVAAASRSDAAKEEKLPANPALWLAIPAHNAYAAEPRAAAAATSPFQALFRTEGGAPISNYVAATWSSLGPAPVAVAEPSPAPVRIRPERHGEALRPPASPQPVPQAQDTDVVSAIGAFFSSLFTASAAAPAASGKRGSS